MLRPSREPPVRTRHSWRRSRCTHSRCGCTLRGSFRIPWFSPGGLAVLASIPFWSAFPLGPAWILWSYLWLGSWRIHSTNRILYSALCRASRWLCRRYCGLSWDSFGANGNATDCQVLHVGRIVFLGL
jgi:hypothetical protein